MQALLLSQTELWPERTLIKAKRGLGGIILASIGARMDSYVKRKKGQGYVVAANIEVRTDSPIKAKRGEGGTSCC